MKIMPNHPTVKLDYPFPMTGEDGKRIILPKLDIDAALAPLMPLVWARGMYTVQCCQESRPGFAEIEFRDSAAVAEFLYIAQKQYPVEVEIVWEEGESGKKHLFNVRLLVLFPTDDIQHLVDAFRKKISI
jgi:hypothetical protein